MHNVLKYTTLFFLITAMLMICGCSVEDEITETGQDESAALTTNFYGDWDDIGDRDSDLAEIRFPYIKYEYSLYSGTFYDETYDVRRNLTGIAGSHKDDVFGWDVINNFITYQRFVESLEKYQTADPSSNVMYEVYRTPSFVVDEAFFTEYDLLIIDWFGIFAVDLNSELSVVEDEMPELTLRLRTSKLVGSTASFDGVLYLIALPKEYHNPHIIWR